MVQQYPADQDAKDRGTSSYGIFKMSFMYEPIYTEFTSEGYEDIPDISSDIENIDVPEKDDARTDQVIFVTHSVVQMTKDKKPFQTHFVLITCRSHIHLRYRHDREEMVEFDIGGGETK